MSNVIYGDGSLYNDGDLYGRINELLSQASEARVRETGLKVSVIDTQLNSWEFHAGTQLYVDQQGLGGTLYKPANGGLDRTDVSYWSYRGGSHMAKLSGGNIIRVRNGDPSDVSDRQIWIQTITDPTNPAQWTSWSVLYGGAHYGTPTIQPTGASTYDVYHCKADGLYKNGSQIWANPGGVKGRKALQWLPVEGHSTAGWVLVLREFTYTTNPAFDFYWSPNPAVTTPVFDLLNSGWGKLSQCSILMDDGVTVARFVCSSFHGRPRSEKVGMEIWAVQQPIADPTDLATLPAPYVVRGLSGGVNTNYYLPKTVVKLSDGFYYLFAQEVHKAGNESGFSNLGAGISTWMRSKDLRFWSEPVVGPPIRNGWGQGGVVEAGGYLYYCDTEVVWRRPTTVITYDISNYVPKLEFDLPRDNQPATGRVDVANPDDVNGAIRTLSDREIVIEPGLKGPDGNYHFLQFNRFFITQSNQRLKGKINRLELAISDVWGRLNTAFRDVTNFIGKIEYDDFKAGASNQPFNYFFNSDTAPSVGTDLGLSTKGRVLYTGWKGLNPDVSVQFYSVTGNPRVYLRFISKDDCLFVEKEGNLISLYDNQGEIDWATTTSDPSPLIRARLILNHYEVWVNGVLELSGQVLDWSVSNFGYVGFEASKYKIKNFHLTDWEDDLKMSDLIKTALAMGDFHDVIVGGADNRAYALTWGPQTDNSNPGDALRQILETQKLQLTWRNGYVQVGRFNDQTPVRTIDNEIVDSDDIDQADHRINLASVDGNEHYWLEIDTDDAINRDRMVVAYFDLPELLDQQSVIDRAREEIKRSSQGSSPGGTTPLFFDLWRMDAVGWTKPDGSVETVRVEGFSVDIDQSKTPHQRQTFDLARFSTSSSDAAMGSDEEVV